MKMIEIDGSFGEGGGQILRTSLSLAAVTGQGVHFTKIRAKRRNPGLMRQHRVCALAAAEICGGTLVGAELNSQGMSFVPGRIHGGEYRFVTGSAGSTLLIAQTILPILLHASEPSRVVLEGGTHAPGAPIYEFFERVFLPCLRRMGAEVSATLVRPGFYPVGGGEIVLEIQPTGAWNRLELVDGGERVSGGITAIGSGLNRDILEDEVRIALETIGAGEWATDVCEVESPGPGNALYLELERQHVTELFSVCGEHDIPRATVARRVAEMARKYLESGAVVGRFLSDQLLLPMALGNGGRFLGMPPTLHAQSNAEIIRRFLNVDIKIDDLSNGTFMFEVKK